MSYIKGMFFCMPKKYRCISFFSPWKGGEILNTNHGIKALHNTIGQLGNMLIHGILYAGSLKT